MKSLSSLFLLALIPLAACAGGTPPNIRVELQIVDVPIEVALPLVPELMRRDKADAAFDKIQDLLAKGTAKLVGWPLLTTHSGARAVVESVDELRYGTEYDPPTVSFTTGVDPKAPIKADGKLDMTRFDAMPSGFETRNMGVTLEVEPALSADGKVIKLNTVAQRVMLNRYDKVTLERPGTGAKVVVEQPEFADFRVTTELTIRNGERVLLGMFATTRPEKHLEFFLLKVEVIPAE